jgi:hypothetical protein
MTNWTMEDKFLGAVVVSCVGMAFLSGFDF